MTVYQSKERIKITPEPKFEPKDPKKYLLFVGICITLSLLAYWKGVDFLEPDADGRPKLAPQREEEYQKRIKRLNEAEQYALLANRNGFFPCYSCEQDSTIFLLVGQVWKYGVTIQGQKKRYTLKGLNTMGLAYEVQLKSGITECLQAEANKIFNYPLLLENTTRAKPIKRPPGNKSDL
jgi:hypothetical protein